MRVVHCKREPYTHYIGRPSILGNPYSHKDGTLAKFKVSSRDVAVDEFEHYAWDHNKILDAIKALPEDAVLGCWCKPQACHGDVIVKIWKELHNVD